MTKHIIELQDGLLVEVEADTADGPRQISLTLLIHNTMAPRNLGIGLLNSFIGAV